MAAIRHIQGNSHQADNFATGAEVRALGGEESAAAGRKRNRNFVGMCLSGVKHLRIRGSHRFGCLCRQNLEIGFANHLHNRVTDHLSAGSIDHHVAALQVFHENDFIDALHDGVKKSMTLTQNVGIVLQQFVRQGQFCSSCRHLRFQMKAMLLEFPLHALALGNVARNPHRSDHISVAVD